MILGMPFLRLAEFILAMVELMALPIFVFDVHLQVLARMTPRMEA
jgi:hypothetical protein